MGDINQYKVRVAVQVRYLADQSDEADDRYVFAYTITISNEGDHPVQLLHRHWIITDANHHVQEVRGKGVVGEQPVIAPGHSFEYTSGTVLATQVGTMQGSYQMQVVDGGEFAVPIPQFVLSVPRTLH
ncbi:MAG: Co2+/Mg2+ efflux protein ApaG [Sideroxydans sp.]